MDINTFITLKHYNKYKKLQKGGIIWDTAVSQNVLLQTMISIS